MKRFKFWMFAAVMACGLTSAMTACSSDDDQNTPTPDQEDSQLTKADYTIMYYSQGGGDLDMSIITNMNQFYSALKAVDANKVQVALQYKASKREAFYKLYLKAAEVTETEAATFANSMGSSTFRMLASSTYNDFFSHLVALQTKAFLGSANSNADITTPDSLANFIKWAAKAAPADKYILILSSHGGGYTTYDDYFQQSPAATRGIIYDDGYENKHHFGVSDITSAIEKSGVHLTAIYLDACMMNNLEYQFELQPMTDYLVLSSFNVPGYGGQYDALVKQLATTSNFETAIKEYVKYTVNFWDTNKITYSDMTATRTSALPAFGAKMKEFADKLVDAYRNGGTEVKTAIDAATKGAFKVENTFPLYDVYDYYHAVAAAAPTYFSAAFVKELDDALNAAIVSQSCSAYLSSNGYKVEATVTLGAQNHYSLYNWQRDANGAWILPANGIYRYESNGTLKVIDPTSGETVQTLTWPSDFDHSYKMTRFDKTTGWSRWLEMNEQEPNERCASEWGI